MKEFGLLREIPSVDSLLSHEAGIQLLGVYPRSLLREAINEVLGDLRSRISAGEIEVLPGPRTLWKAAGALVRERLSPDIVPVINATGVVIHTNLGRSLLASSAVDAVVTAATSYTNLEYDLKAGARGDRYTHVTRALGELTGAEDALVVNNNAAAVLLTLQTLASGREVVVSRGELVEIGGSFRIPDVMSQSGAVLVEVGTTNRTHPGDYENAVGDETAALMKVHASNFRVVGFTREVSVGELAAIARPRGLPVIYDMGSGVLTGLEEIGDFTEETASAALEAGADVVTFSGDKLLGGPQAGIIAGRSEYLSRMKSNPLLRALRVDKLTLAALDATLKLYLQDRGWQDIPTLRMMAADLGQLRARAEELAESLQEVLPADWMVEVVDEESPVGGGSLPLVNLPTAAVRLQPDGGPEEISRLLRDNDPPVIVRTSRGSLFLDVRTILPGDEEEVADALERIAGSSASSSRDGG